MFQGFSTLLHSDFEVCTPKNKQVSKIFDEIMKNETNNLSVSRIWTGRNESIFESSFRFYLIVIVISCEKVSIFFPSLEMNLRLFRFIKITI